MTPGHAPTIQATCSIKKKRYSLIHKLLNTLHTHRMHSAFSVYTVYPHLHHYLHTVLKSHFWDTQPKKQTSVLLLMVQKSGDHQLLIDSSTHYLQSLIQHPGGWLRRISEPSTVLGGSSSDVQVVNKHG